MPGIYADPDYLLGRRREPRRVKDEPTMPEYRPAPWNAGRTSSDPLLQSSGQRDSFAELIAQIMEMPGMTPEQRRAATMRLLGVDPEPRKTEWTGSAGRLSRPAPSQSSGFAGPRLDEGGTTGTTGKWGPGYDPGSPGGLVDDGTPDVQLPELPPLDPELAQARKAPPAARAAAPADIPVPMPRPARSAAGAAAAPAKQPESLADLMLSAPEPDAAPMGLKEVAGQKIAGDAAKEGAPEWALPLIVAGLSMAASDRPGLLQAAAEGGIAGVNALYQQRRDRRQEGREQREDERLDLAGKREERQLAQGERRLGIEEQGARDLAAYRRGSMDLDREKLGISQADSAADRAYKQDYLEYLKSQRQAGGNRAPTRPEQFEQIYAGFAQKMPPEQALQATKELWATINPHGSDTDPLEKLQSDPDFWMMTPEERSAIIAELGGGGGAAAADPTDAFFEQLMQQSRGMSGGMGFE